MNIKNSKRSTRVSSKKVTISNHAKGLTSQAGLVPVVKFLRRIGMVGLIKENVDHERGAKALYDSVDAGKPINPMANGPSAKRGLKEAGNCKI